MTSKRKPQIDLDLDYVNKLKSIGMSSKSIPDVTFSFADYQCLERLMNIRDITIEDELKNHLKELYEKDNDMMCNNIAEIVRAQNSKIFTVLEAQTKIIESIASDITTIKIDITNIKDRMKILEDTVEEDEAKIRAIQSKCDERLERITKIEKDVKLLNPDAIKELIKDIEEAKPKLTKLLRYSSPWSTSLRVGVAMIMGWIMTWMLMKYIWHLI